ncbi:MAG: hypothetical protein M3R36_13525 [Bacteroidota bacterium]|nr:hypothetical protein [Bacteroidota bacterium]
MNTLKKTLRIPKDRELKIRLPDTFEIDKEVTVVIEQQISGDHKNKIELMKKAAKDPLFLQDVEEIMEDFKHVDFETLK